MRQRGVLFLNKLIEKRKKIISRIYKEKERKTLSFLTILISTSLLENTVSGLLIFLLSCNLLCKVFPVKIKKIACLSFRYN